MQEQELGDLAVAVQEGLIDGAAGGVDVNIGLRPTGQQGLHYG